MVRQLHAPRGMLSGFGWRISSLIFGSQEASFQVKLFSHPPLPPLPPPCSRKGVWFSIHVRLSCQEAHGMVVNNVSAGQK